MPNEPTDLDIALDAEIAGNPAANVTVANVASAETPALAQQPQPQVQTQPQTVTEPVSSPPLGQGPTPQTPATPATPAQDSYLNARDYAARALGYQNAAQYADDSSFIQALTAGQRTLQDQLAEARQMAQLGQLYLQQQASVQRPQPTPEDPFAALKAPEWNAAWTADLAQDPTTGEIKVRPGADPTILPKYMAYQAHRRDMLDKITTDPVNFLTPIIQQAVQSQATQLVQHHFAQAQERQYVDSFMNQNAGWLFQRDAAGNAVFNPATNKPIVSAAGQRFYQYLREAEQGGIAHPQLQENYAKALLARDIAQPKIEQSYAESGNDASKQRLLQTMNRNPNVGGPPAGGAIPVPDNTGLSLADQMRQAFKANGFTEESVRDALVS